jgi:hypothetical protein
LINTPIAAKSQNSPEFAEDFNYKLRIFFF